MTKRTLIALAMATSFSGVVRADVVDTTWIGGSGSADWFNAAKWSAGVPNNDPPTTFNAWISAGATVNLATGAKVEVDTLTLGPSSPQSNRVWVRPSAQLTIVNAMTLNGILEPIGSGTVRFLPGAVLTGSGSINFSNDTGRGRIYCDGGAFTVPSGIRVFGNGIVGEITQPLNFGADLTSNNFKVIDLFGSTVTKSGPWISNASGAITSNVQATQSFANSGPITFSSSGILNVTTQTASNSAVITASTGSITINAPGGISNSGTVTVNSGAYVVFDGPLTNTGKITVNGGTFGVGGTVTQDFVNTITNSNGNLWSTGTLENANRELLINGSTPRWVVGGTLHGGTITTANGAQLTVRPFRNTATFDDVTVNGDVLLRGGLRIPAGQSLHGNGTLRGTNFGTDIAAVTGTLTIGSGITVRSTNVGTATEPLVNNGRIVGGLIAGTPIINNGVIEGGARFGGTFTRAGLGTLVNGTSPFAIAGTLDNTGQTFTLDAVTGSWVFGDNFAGSFPEVGGTIRGGTLRTRDGKVMTVPDYCYGALDDVTLDGDVVMNDRTRLYLPNGRISGSGTVSLNVNGHLDGATSQILPGPVGGPGAGSLTIEAGITIRGFGDEFFAPETGIGQAAQTQSVINHGSIRADLRTLTIAATSISNDGVFGASSAARLLTIGDLTFVDDGALDVQLSATENKGLLGVTGALNLDSAADALLLSPGPNIAAGTFYKIVTTTGGITGTFDSIPAGYEVTYTSTEIFARVVPEPTSSGCFAIGTAAAAFVRRHRRRDS